MSRRTIVLLTCTFLVAVLFREAPRSQGHDIGTALSGTVSSAKEGAMEGVLVSAKRVGGTVTITVVSNGRGRYGFSKDRLAPGTYAISIRAAGFEVAPTKVDVAADKTAVADLRLMPVSDVLPQLSNAEILMSLPDSPQKKKLLDCVDCHKMLTRALQSRYRGEQWYPVLHRMETYHPGSSPWNPQPNPNAASVPMERDEALANYLSSVNLSASDKYSYAFKTLPRPTGRGTKVIITEYDLPREGSHPHDVAVDGRGTVWYDDFTFPYLGKLDPATGAIKEYAMPVLRPGFPVGANATEIGADGHVYVATLKQGYVGRFDPKTETFETFKAPVQNAFTHLGMVSPTPQGWVWFTVNTDATYKTIDLLDTKTGKIDAYDPWKDLPDGRAGRTTYGVSSDSKGNGYFLEMGTGGVGKVDAVTRKITVFPTPTRQSGARRGDMDSQDRLWFGEYYAGKVGMFDTQTEEMREWTLPGSYAKPYDVAVDAKGDVWAGGMHTDFLYRLNPRTGEITEYLLPAVQGNIRKMSSGMDYSARSVVLYIGMNHAGRIARIEPLD